MTISQLADKSLVSHFYDCPKSKDYRAPKKMLNETEAVKIAREVFDIKEDEIKEVDELFGKIAPVFNEGIRKSKLGLKQNDGSLTVLLEQTETNLKQCMSKRGMLSVTKKDPRLALSGG